MALRNVVWVEAWQHAVAFAEQQRTAQLVIIQQGEVVVDESFHSEPVDVYAVQKGLVSVLFGIAAERGFLELDAPVSDLLGLGWTELSPEVELELTIRRALNMTTGLDDELCPLGEVGVTWRYDNVTYNYLKTALEIATDQSLAELTKAWLCEPLGMASTRWVERSVMRPDGRPITGLESTAQDLARFGAMVLAGGGDVTPKEHVTALGRPGSDENPSWGLCWWSNDQSHHRLPRREAEVQPGPVTPEAPSDMIAARGALENAIYVVPSLDLVVARTALPVRPPQGTPPFDREFWRRLAA